MIDVEGEFTCDGSPEDLWRYFTDPDILADAAPGCEEIHLVTPSRLAATLSVGVGSVKPTFDVEALVVECDRPNSLELRASGTASRNSFEASARQELVDNGDGTTTVRWTATAEVSGIIASMGERALASVGKKLVDDFFRNLEDHANAGTPAESRLEAASPEELTAAGYGPDAADAETGKPAVGGGPTAPGRAGDGPLPVADWRALALVTGVVGVLLWRRLRPESVRRRTGRSFVVGVLVGVAATVLWGRYRSADESMGAAGDEPVADERIGDLGTDEHAGKVETDEHAGGYGANEQPDATFQKDGVGASGADADSASGGGYFDENPLDRLESRDSA